eukprot:m.205406 g.205406  ORF g.205406 m.205406 type:complete len:259 (-) comp22919_c0_seq1:94-870(-)
MSLLAGKRILVTGASSGIGAATARVLLNEGAQVFVTGRNTPALEAVEGAAGHITADLAVPGETDKVAAAAVNAMGSLSGLVNCAGVLRGGVVGTDASALLEGFDYNFAVNTRAPFAMMLSCVPYLKALGGGAIVTVSSVNAKQSFAGTASYCGSKAAIDHMSRCAALDLAPDGIRVNTVNPGVVVTPLQQRGGMDDETYAAFLERSVSTTHPLAKSRGTVAQPEEVGDLIAFLMSDRAAFITGECIAIDGGRQCLGAR